MTFDINHRARKILYAIVSEYLATGDAVGSRTVTRRHGIDLSPATVRNVMSDLEEMGLLEQPHTSAGRVPTETGLRFFIDSLLKVRSLSPREKDDIRDRYGKTLDFDALLKNTSRVLSDITHYAGIVLAPAPGRQTLKQIEFVPLSNGRFLGILVTTDGRIENKLVQLEGAGALEPAQLERIHAYLNQTLEGLTLDEVRARVLREMGEEKNRYDRMVAQALQLSQAALEGASATTADVIVSGAPNLLDPARPAEPETLARMRALLHALEEKDLLVRLLDRTMASDRIQVFLGAETPFEALGETAVVAMPYGPGERPVGAIAVIGPTRMNYGKVMSVVDFTADLVTEMLTSK
jgi:heat-inducible transcriptional repressor